MIETAVGLWYNVIATHNSAHKKGPTMKLYAPGYYKNFKCIADKCDHSCCVGWEIDIDSDMLNKYKNLRCTYGDVIAESISDDITPHFKLTSDERCPHLDERGLCKIIINLGEDYLCDICREHPRFYNYTSVAEVGIGMSCTEAAKIILSSPNYTTSEFIGEVDGDEDILAYDGRAKRCEIYTVLSDSTRSYNKRLCEIYSDGYVDPREDEFWLDRISSLEYLDPAHKNLFMKYSKNARPSGCDEYLERFLAYLIYRHCTETFDEDDFTCRLSFCLFCERLLASLIFADSATTLDEIATLARIISEEIEYSDDNTENLMYW